MNQIDASVSRIDPSTVNSASYSYVNLSFVAGAMPLVSVLLSFTAAAAAAAAVTGGALLDGEEREGPIVLVALVVVAALVYAKVSVPVKEPADVICDDARVVGPSFRVGVES